jgi:hypothetical protein
MFQSREKDPGLSGLVLRDNLNSYGGKVEQSFRQVHLYLIEAKNQPQDSNTIIKLNRALCDSEAVINSYSELIRLYPEEEVRYYKSLLNSYNLHLDDLRIEVGGYDNEHSLIVGDEKDGFPPIYPEDDPLFHNKL